MIEEIRSSISSIENINQFKNWTRQFLRPILPHGAAIFGLGFLHAGGVGLDFIITIDFPIGHIVEIRNKVGAIETPILRRCLATGKPQLFESEHPWPEASEQWLKSFRKHDLRNALAHAHVDSEQCIGTYHSLYRMPKTPGQTEISTFEYLIPHLHEALCRCIDRLGNVSAGCFNERELKVIEELRQGKTNAEIADILKISENTVKHYMTRLFEHFNVKNRAQLVRLLMDQGRRASSIQSCIL